jgi:uncharacterized damage-inducible protein DinB
MAMNEGKRISQLVWQVYDGEPHHKPGEAWHGPSLSGLLKGITAEQATRKSVKGGHSIWELVLHIAGWNEVIARRLAGERIEHPLDSPGDWPLVGEPTEAAWRAALDKLARSVRSVEQAAAAASDDKLEENAVGRQFTNYVMMHGIVHHIAYHSGQIALLRKALAEP